MEPIQSTVIPGQRYNVNDNIRKLIDPSWQGINRLFVLTYLNDPSSTVNSHRKYFLPRAEIKNYNIEIEKYQQVKVMVTQLVVHWIFLILNTIKD